jgi:hypothetical protein
MQINRYVQATGSARVEDIAERLRIPAEVLEPTFTRLVDTGYAFRTGSEYWPTGRGLRQVDFVSSLVVARIMQQLSRSSEFEHGPDRLDVENALERVAQRMLVQRNWDDDADRTVALPRAAAN